MPLTKKTRLSSADIERTFKYGRGKHSGHFLFKYLRDVVTKDEGLAVLVPMRVASKATQRNAIRRMVTGIIKPIQVRMIAGISGVLVVNKAPEDRSAAVDEIITLLEKSAMLKK